MAARAKQKLRRRRSAKKIKSGPTTRPHAARARSTNAATASDAAAARNMKVALEPASVRGFRFSGVSAGLKTKAGALDLGLIVADRPCAAAAVFSANRVKAAPVYVTADRVKAGRLQAGCAATRGADTFPRK